MQAKDPKYIIVVDQGSRAAPPIVDSADVKSLLIDHHQSDVFPKNALVGYIPPTAPSPISNPKLTLLQVVSAYHYPPIATSALLTYELCKPLHPNIEASCGYLYTMGTHGDLGNTLKWKPPFPDMIEVFRTHTKKAINDAVALINARRYLSTSTKSQI